MKYLHYITLICTYGLIAPQLSAQDISGSLNEARSAYNSGSLDDARFALEQTLHEIDQAIGKEILGILPTSISGMPFMEEQDNVEGTNIGMVGLFVNRSYSGEDDKFASVEVIGDSPLMAGLNAILSMPAVLTTGDQNQKRIKVDGYKSILQKETDTQGVESFTIQIPANSTLISFQCSGYSESQAIGMVNGLPIAQIVRLAQ